MSSTAKHIVLAAAAHPDDIEFMMAGTLLRLRDAGAEIHMWDLANGSCGTATHSKEEIIRLRGAEAQASARLAGAVPHEPLADDIALYYEPDLLARAAAVVRQVHPTIILTQSPQDYMENHQNTCRLVISAAFVRGMRNFATSPAIEPVGGVTTVYHGMPHGLRDGLRNLVRPGQYVDIGPVLARKRQMLAQHRTQKEWLDVSQGMDAYLLEMENMSREVGRLSGRFEFAEGWRRHSHFGFCSADADPLTELLGAACWTDQKYEEGLGITDEHR
jgi:LmbE family N-acetylglucosaminyl deacetylase